VVFVWDNDRPVRGMRAEIVQAVDRPIVAS